MRKYINELQSPDTNIIDLHITVGALQIPSWLPSWTSRPEISSSSWWSVQPIRDIPNEKEPLTEIKSLEMKTHQGFGLFLLTKWSAKKLVPPTAKFIIMKNSWSNGAICVAPAHGFGRPLDWNPPRAQNPAPTGTFKIVFPSTKNLIPVVVHSSL